MSKNCDICRTKPELKEYEIEYVKTYYRYVTVKAYTESEAIDKACPGKPDFNDTNWSDYGRDAEISNITEVEND